MSMSLFMKGHKDKPVLHNDCINLGKEMLLKI